MHVGPRLRRLRGISEFAAGKYWDVHSGQIGVRPKGDEE